MSDKLHDMQRAFKKALKRAAELEAIEEPTEENQTELDEVLTEAETLKDNIQRAERQANLKTFAESTEEPEERQEVATAPKVEIPDVRLSFGEVLVRLAKHQRAIENGGTFRDASLMQYAAQIGEQRAATGMSETSPQDGGFFVDQDMSNRLIEKIHETGQVARLCDKIPIGPNANGIKMNGVDETSRADGSRWGGVRAYWKDEAASMTASQPKFSQIELNLEKVTCLYYATDELLQDAPALASRVEGYMTEEIAFKVDAGIVEGDGAGKPLGIKNSPSLVSITAETGQAATTIEPENIIKMYARAWNPSKSRGVWLANADTLPQLMTMSIEVGTGGIPLWIPGNNLTGKPFDTLLGRPIIYIEQAETLGTAGDIYFADMSQYILIEKGDVQSAMSIHVNFTSNETVFRFIYRVNGQPTWESALTPYKGTDTVSPFLNTATRS